MLANWLLISAFSGSLRPLKHQVNEIFCLHFFAQNISAAQLRWRNSAWVTKGDKGSNDVMKFVSILPFQETWSFLLCFQMHMCTSWPGWHTHINLIFFWMILVVERKTVKLCADKRIYRLFLCSKIYWLGWKQWNSVPAEQDKRMQPNIGDAPKIRDPRWSRTKCPGWSITTSHNVTQCQPKVMSFRKEIFVISRRRLPVGEWF